MFKAVRPNGDVMFFESSSLEQAKRDAWDSKVTKVSEQAQADMEAEAEKALASEEAAPADATTGAPS